MQVAAYALPLPELAAGEIYLGAIGNKDGQVYHVILLPGDNADASWQAQMEWAKSIGGDLPSRIEQAILWANHRDQFQKAAYWSNTEDDDPEYSGWAWYQHFSYGSQGYDVTDGEFRARAVRRLSIQSFTNSSDEISSAAERIEATGEV